MKEPMDVAAGGEEEEDHRLKGKKTLIARRRIGYRVIVGRGEEESAGNIELFSTSFFFFPSPFA